MLFTPTRKSRAMAGSAMPTTVASSAARPEPRAVAARTQRPRAVPKRRPRMPAPGVAAPGLSTRGEVALVAAQVFQDVLAELAGLPAVDHRPGESAGEQRAEGEGAAAHSADES